MFTISVGMPGPFELMIVLAIVLILFGAGKLPKVLGQMGKGVKAFKEGLSDKVCRRGRRRRDPRGRGRGRAPEGHRPRA